jgi:hypothetical protein
MHIVSVQLMFLGLIVLNRPGLSETIQLEMDFLRYRGYSA